MTYPAENIFNLPDPDSFECSVLLYQRPHAYLRLEAVNRYTSQAYLLNFPATEYFEGPLGWKGANFCLGSQDEFSELLHKFRRGNIDSMLHTYHLFVVESKSGFRIRIIAANANIRGV